MKGILRRAAAPLHFLLHPSSFILLGSLRQHPPRPLDVPGHYVQSRLPPDPPLISVITPSLNQGRFIERALGSVLDQGYPRLEYIVQDGGSSDGTADILERYRGHLTHCESAPDHGQADALNRGFGRATGAVLAWLNADDLLLPGTLAYVAGYFAARPEVDVVYGHRVLIDEDDREVGRWVLPPHTDAALRWRDYVPQETLFWRRQIWERVGGRLDDRLHFALDWDLLLRFRAAGARFARLPRFLGAFRVHAEQKTAGRLADVGAREVEWLRRRWNGRALSEREIDRRVCGYLCRHLLHHALYRLGVLRY